MTDGQPSAVQCDGISVQLGEQFALQHVSMSIPVGAFCTILGPNGGGKSTFLRVLLGLQAVTRGSVQLFDAPISAVNPRRIGTVPQSKRYDQNFPARALDVVATGIHGKWSFRLDETTRASCLQALDRVGLRSLADRRVGVLSGGELQRVYLARALVRQPELLLLDEPATGMDVRSEADLHSILEDYQTDHTATVVMVSHDWSTAKHHSSHIMLLNSTLRWSGASTDGPDDEVMREVFGHRGHMHPMTQVGCTHG